MMTATDHRERAAEAMGWALAERDPELKAYWFAAAQAYAAYAERAEARECAQRRPGGRAGGAPEHRA